MTNTLAFINIFKGMIPRGEINLQLTGLFFLFMFLPLAILFSYFDRSVEYKNFILIVFSALFFVWGKGIGIAVCAVLLSSVLDWLLGLLCGSKKHTALRALGLAAAILGNAALVIWAAWDMQLVGVRRLALVLYGLRAVSYAFDCFTRKTAAEKNLLNVMTYLISFPMMTAAPLVRYSDICADIRGRNVDGGDISQGLDSMVIGLAKFAVASPVLLAVTSAGFDRSEITLSGSIIGMAAYILRFCIYWSALADISVGCGRLFGFVYPKGYSFVDMSKGVTGLVKNLNGTLNGFAYDVTARPILKKSRIAAGFACIICGALSAAWFGQSIFFLAAGAAAGLIFAAERLLSKKFNGNKAITWCYTAIVLIVIVGITRFDSVSALADWGKGLIGMGEPYILSAALKEVIKKYFFVLLTLALIYFPPVRYLCKRVIQQFSQKSVRWYGAFMILKTLALCVLLLLSAASLAGAAPWSV